MLSTIKRFIDDEQGATSIEYALIAILISVFIISAVSGVGDRVSDLFNTVDTTMSTAVGKVKI
jgi:pilus assembly protein Flp/PilA